MRCRRCGAVLYRAIPRALDATLALTLAAAVLFVIANVFPVMSLELQGRHVLGDADRHRAGARTTKA